MWQLALALDSVDWRLILAIAVIAFLLVYIFVAVQFFGLWLQAYMSNAGITLVEFIGMRFRKVNARVIVHSKIRADKAGLNISTNELETHYLAGGRVPDVITAMIAANRNGTNLDFKAACAIDLCGDGVFGAEQAFDDGNDRANV